MIFDHTIGGFSITTDLIGSPSQPLDGRSDSDRRNSVGLVRADSKSHVVGNPHSRAVAELWLEYGADLM
jgi:hypothetical protein